MGRIEELITDHFVKRIVMYVGVYEFREVGFWLSGFDYANRNAFPNEVSDLHGFKEWLLVRIGGNCVFAWPGIISENYGHGREATDRFFELFKEFRIAVDTRGLECILIEHYDFEVESYGAPRVSELRDLGEDLFVTYGVGGKITSAPASFSGDVRAVKEESRKEYNAIECKVGDEHREPLAKKFRAFAFGIRKGLISFKVAASAEAAMVKDEVGEADASKFTDWQDAYRKAIGTTTMPDDDLATQYEQVADGLVKLKRDFNLAALLRTLAGFEKFGMFS